MFHFKTHPFIFISNVFPSRFSPLTLCFKSAFAWYFFECFGLWKKTSRYVWASPSELRLGEWAYCMFPLLFFNTFYLWHLGQPPTHSSWADATCRGPQWQTQVPSDRGFPPLGAHVMHYVSVFLCIWLSVHFQGTPRVADWGGRAKLRVNVWK